MDKRELTPEIIYFDEEMPDNLDEYAKKHWHTMPDDCYLKQYPVPDGYAIVRSGRTKEGDILLGWTGWDGESLFSPKYKQVLNCEVGHFHGVARKINSLQTNKG